MKACHHLLTTGAYRQGGRGVTMLRVPNDWGRRKVPKMSQERHRLYEVCSRSCRKNGNTVHSEDVLCNVLTGI